MWFSMWLARCHRCQLIQQIPSCELLGFDSQKYKSFFSFIAGVFKPSPRCFMAILRPVGQCFGIAPSETSYDLHAHEMFRVPTPFLGLICSSWINVGFYQDYCRCRSGLTDWAPGTYPSARVKLKSNSHSQDAAEPVLLHCCSRI